MSAGDQDKALQRDLRGFLRSLGDPVTSRRGPEFMPNEGVAEGRIGFGVHPHSRCSGSAQFTERWWKPSIDLKHMMARQIEPGTPSQPDCRAPESASSLPDFLERSVSRDHRGLKNKPGHLVSMIIIF